MSDVTHSVASMAGEAYAAFERRNRSITEGDEFWTLRDGAPSWVHDIVREAHGDFLPDDWRYEAIRAALNAIHENADDDPDGYSGEFADGMVDTYNGDRLAWLASNAQRAGYVDEACSEMGAPEPFSLIEAIGLGQDREAQEVYHAVLVGLRHHADA